MSGWRLAYDGFDPRQERLREALCTLGNGYFATRGAGEESSADEVHYPGTYMAGGYNRLRSEVAGKLIENEDLVNLPNWLPLTFRLQADEGEWFDLRRVELLEYRQELHLRQGVLRRSYRFRDEQGRITRVASQRLVHMRYPHLAALQLTITPENWSGQLELKTALDGRVQNAGVARYRELDGQHLVHWAQEVLEDNILLLKVQTSQSEIRVSQAARTLVSVEGEPLQPQRRTLLQRGVVGQTFTVEAAAGRPVVVEKTAALFSSRDRAISESSLEAAKEVRRAAGFDGLLSSHVQAWDHLWCLFDIELEQEQPVGQQETMRIMHLHLFHLLQTVSPHTIDLDASSPARGLHGEAYRGHIFWDELFIFPVLNLRLPQITRELLRYRYRRLEEARVAARAEGFRGAMFPWQSGSDGREESQLLHLNPHSGRWIPDRSRLQRHINIAIAYNVWQYYQVTGDLAFISYYGAEMVLEIARFWASKCTFNEELGRFEILQVMGPDEYSDGYPDSDQPGINNNAYTNVMTAWVMRCALAILDLLPSDREIELRERLGILAEEIDRWDEISRRMRVVFHADGIISQYEDYAELAELDWDAYREKYGDIHRMDRILEAEGDSANNYKLSKQADVLMLFYLLSAAELEALFARLGYAFDRSAIPKNIDYYTQRTAHGSTLSRVVSAWVLVRSDRVASWQLFRSALESDVTDIQGGTTPEGIHLGAMAGTVDLVQRCYSGIKTHDEVLWLNPRLPESLQRLHFHIRYRGQALTIHLTQQALQISSSESYQNTIQIGFDGEVYSLQAGQSREFPLQPAGERRATG